MRQRVRTEALRHGASMNNHFIFTVRNSLQELPLGKMRKREARRLLTFLQFETSNILQMSFWGFACLLLSLVYICIHACEHMCIKYMLYNIDIQIS